MHSENLITEVLLRLNDKILDSELKIVEEAIRISVADYEVTRKSFEIIPYEGLPDEYKMYIVSKKIEGRSQGTLDLYKLCLEDMLTTISKPLDKITSNDIRIYLYNLQKERKVSDRTLDSRRLIINGFFKWLWEESRIPTNPCASIKPIHYESKPREPISDIEMEKLRNACTSLRDSAILETLYSTGCRCAELSNLKKDDIDMQTTEVKVFGKGKKHRVTYLNARAVVALENYLASRDDDSEYLFVSTRKPHNKIGNGGIEQIIANIASRAGLSNIHPHRLRHTFATNALQHGMDIHVLQKLLAHSSIDTTMIYAKTSTSEISSSHKKYII